MLFRLRRRHSTAAAAATSRHHGYAHQESLRSDDEEESELEYRITKVVGVASGRPTPLVRRPWRLRRHHSSPSLLESTSSTNDSPPKQRRGGVTSVAPPPVKKPNPSKQSSQKKQSKSQQRSISPNKKKQPKKSKTSHSNNKKESNKKLQQQKKKQSMVDESTMDNINLMGSTATETSPSSSSSRGRSRGRVAPLLRHMTRTRNKQAQQDSPESSSSLLLPSYNRMASQSLPDQDGDVAVNVVSPARQPQHHASTTRERTSSLLRATWQRWRQGRHGGRLYQSTHAENSQANDTPREEYRKRVTPPPREEYRDRATPPRRRTTSPLRPPRPGTPPRAPDTPLQAEWVTPPRHASGTPPRHVTQPTRSRAPMVTTPTAPVVVLPNTSTLTSSQFTTPTSLYRRQQAQRNKQAQQNSTKTSSQSSSHAATATDASYELGQSFLSHYELDHHTGVVIQNHGTQNHQKENNDPKPLALSPFASPVRPRSTTVVSIPPSLTSSSKPALWSMEDWNAPPDESLLASPLPASHEQRQRRQRGRIPTPVPADPKKSKAKSHGNNDPDKTFMIPFLSIKKRHVKLRDKTPTPSPTPMVAATTTPIPLVDPTEETIDFSLPDEDDDDQDLVPTIHRQQHPHEMLSMDHWMQEAEIDFQTSGEWTNVPEVELDLQDSLMLMSSWENHPRSDSQDIDGSTNAVRHICTPSSIWPLLSFSQPNDASAALLETIPQEFPMQDSLYRSTTTATSSDKSFEKRMRRHAAMTKRPGGKSPAMVPEEEEVFVSDDDEGQEVVFFHASSHYPGSTDDEEEDYLPMMHAWKSESVGDYTAPPRIIDGSVKVSGRGLGSSMFLSFQELGLSTSRSRDHDQGDEAAAPLLSTIVESKTLGGLSSSVAPPAAVAASSSHISSLYLSESSYAIATPQPRYRQEATKTVAPPPPPPSVPVLEIVASQRGEDKISNSFSGSTPQMAREHPSQMSSGEEVPAPDHAMIARNISNPRDMSLLNKQQSMDSSGYIANSSGLMGTYDEADISFSHSGRLGAAPFDQTGMKISAILQKMGASGNPNNTVSDNNPTNVPPSYARAASPRPPLKPRSVGPPLSSVATNRLESQPHQPSVPTKAKPQEKTVASTPQQQHHQPSLAKPVALQKTKPIVADKYHKAPGAKSPAVESLNSCDVGIDDSSSQYTGSDITEHYRKDSRPQREITLFETDDPLTALNSGKKQPMDSGLALAASTVPTDSSNENLGKPQELPPGAKKAVKAAVSSIRNQIFDTMMNPSDEAEDDNVDPLPSLLKQPSRSAVAPATPESPYERRKQRSYSRMAQIPIIQEEMPVIATTRVTSVDDTGTLTPNTPDFETNDKPGHRRNPSDGDCGPTPFPFSLLPSSSTTKRRSTATDVFSGILSCEPEEESIGLNKLHHPHPRRSSNPSSYVSRGHHSSCSITHRKRNKPLKSPSSLRGTRSVHARFPRGCADATDMLTPLALCEPEKKKKKNQSIKETVLGKEIVPSTRHPSDEEDDEEPNVKVYKPFRSTKAVQGKVVPVPRSVQGERNQHERSISSLTTPTTTKAGETPKRLNESPPFLPPVQEGQDDAISLAPSSVSQQDSGKDSLSTAAQPGCCTLLLPSHSQATTDKQKKKSFHQVSRDDEEDDVCLDDLDDYQNHVKTVLKSKSMLSSAYKAFKSLWVRTAKNKTEL